MNTGRWIQNSRKDKTKFKAVFYGVDGKKTELPDNDAVQDVMKRLDQKGDFDIMKVEAKERKRNPQPAAQHQQCNKRRTHNWTSVRVRYNDGCATIVRRYQLGWQRR